MQAPELSIVVPTYGGRDALEELVDRLDETLNRRGYSYEIIIVNDASPDETWQLLEKLSADKPHVRAVDLLSNHGQSRATLCGLSRARGDLVATMDDDLQHPPEELPRLVDALLEHPDWDAVVGSWPRDEGLVRDLGSWLNEMVDRLAHGTSPGFRHTAFRVLRRPVVDALLDHETRTPVLWSLLMKTSYRIENVSVRHDDRPYGSSNFRFREGARTVLTSFFQGSTLPLRFLSILGFSCSALAAVTGFVYVLRALFGVDTPPGWASSFLAVVFFGGATLFGVGLIGEYIRLVMVEVKRPPRWMIRRELGTRTDASPEQEGV